MPHPHPVSRDLAATVEDARLDAEMSWSQLAEELGAPLVWTVAALLGSHPLPKETATKVGELLGLDDDVVRMLQRFPYRTADAAVDSDPTIYRFHELLTVYGPALKALIHEEFGDGIMSAINCKVDFARRPDPDGDRVVITIDGKFLPYQW